MHVAGGSTTPVDEFEARRDADVWGAPAPLDWGRVWIDPVRRLWEHGARAFGAASYPALDLYDRGDEVVIEADLPGVQPDDVEVEVTDHHLRIRGQVRRTEERQEAGVYRQERRFGSFMRTVALPEDVDPERATASFRHGVLQLRLPKKEGRRRRIPIDREG